MMNEEFMRWIAGFSALSDDTDIDTRQFSIIKNHALLVREVCGSFYTEVKEFLEALENNFKDKDFFCKKTFDKLVRKYFFAFI